MGFSLTSLAMLFVPAAIVGGKGKAPHLQLVPQSLPLIEPAIASDGDSELSPVPLVVSSVIGRQEAMAAFMAELDDLCPGEHVEFRGLLGDYHDFGKAKGWPVLTDRAFGLELKFHGCKKYIAPRNKKGVRRTMVIIPTQIKKRRRRA